MRERVVRDQIETARDITLQMKHERVVARAIVGAEHLGGGKRIGTIGVVSFFVSVVRARGPIGVECVLHAGGRMQRVRGLVIGIDQRRRRIRTSIHRLESSRPSVLREIVVEKPKATADYGTAAGARRIGKPEAGAELFAVIMRRALRKSKRGQQRKRRINPLIMPRCDEETKRSLPAQSVVERHMARKAPRILRVNSETLDTLREGSVAGGSGGGSARVVDGKLREIRGIQRVERGIVGK